METLTKLEVPHKS